MGKVSSKKVAQEFVEDIIKQIGLDAEVAVKDEADSLKIEINGDNLGALIGYHGETLESLQLITTLIINKELTEGDWRRVTIDIGGWRKDRAKALLTMIENSVAQIEQENLEKLTLPTMSSSQRREAHVIVSEKFPNFSTSSEGEEPNRRVVLFRN